MSATLASSLALALALIASAVILAGLTRTFGRIRKTPKR